MTKIQYIFIYKKKYCFLYNLANTEEKANQFIRRVEKKTRKNLKTVTKGLILCPK